MKSSFSTSTTSNSITISESAAGGVAPAFSLVGGFTVLVIAVGERKDAEVAGRGSMRGAETGAMRPVAVAGRVGWLICGIFLVEPATAAGAARTACSRFDER